MSQPPDQPQQPDQPSWGQPPPGWNPQAGGQPPPPGWGAAPTPGPGGPVNYSPTDAIGYGWKAFQANVGPLLAVTAVVVIGGIAVNLVMGLIFGGSLVSFDLDGGFEFSPLVLVGNLISQAVALILSAAAIRVALDLVEGRGVDIGQMFSRFDIVQVVVAGILVGIASTIGLLLCILPGIAVLVFTWFTNYFIVGEGQDAITAIKSSVNLVKDNFGPVLLFALLAFVCMLAGMLACGIGVFVAFPVVQVAAAYTFRMLRNQPVAQL